jgi:hypothetical protein
MKFYGKKKFGKGKRNEKGAGSARRTLGKLSDDFKYGSNMKRYWEPFIDRMKIQADEKGFGICFDQARLARAKVRPIRPPTIPRAIGETREQKEERENANKLEDQLYV